MNSTGSDQYWLRQINYITLHTLVCHYIYYAHFILTTLWLKIIVYKGLTWSSGQETRQCTLISLQSKLTHNVINSCLTDKHSSTPHIQCHSNRVNTKHGGTKYHMAVPALIFPAKCSSHNSVPHGRWSAVHGDTRKTLDREKANRNRPKHCII